MMIKDERQKAEDEKDFLKTFLKLMGGILTSLRTIILLDNLESIGQYSFGDCYSLQSITLGKNLRQIGFGAFQFCTSLTNITIPSGII